MLHPLGNTIFASCLQTLYCIQKNLHKFTSVAFWIQYYKMNWNTFTHLHVHEQHLPIVTTLLTLFNTFQSLQEEEVDQELELLVLASDGLWDVVTNEVSSSTYCNVWFWSKIV